MKQGQTIIRPQNIFHGHMIKMIPSAFVFNFFLLLPTSIMSCLQVSMDKITALVTFSEKILANRLIMTSYSAIPLLISDLIISFISGVVSLYYLYSSFSCSLPRFLTQPSVSLGEPLESRVFSLVSTIQSSLFLNVGGVFFTLYQVYYTLLHFYLGCLVLE